MVAKLPSSSIGSYIEIILAWASCGIINCLCRQSAEIWDEILSFAVDYFQDFAELVKGAESTALNAFPFVHRDRQK